MAIYTKHGLKIRLDENAIESVISPLKESGQLEDLLMDIELWMDLPNAISNVTAILTAFLTGSWVFTLLFGILGYFVGAIIHEVTYSEILKRIFPLFLGSWIISILATIGCGIYLTTQGNYVTIVILALLVFGNWLHYTDFLLIFLAPFRILVMKSSQKRLGVRHAYTLAERLFIFLCNKRAQKIGVELNWKAYDKSMNVG